MRKPIIGFENYYEVDEKGNIYSLPKLKVTPTTTYMTKERILKPYFSKKGYLWVDLSVKDKRKTRAVHRIVAEAFIPNPENKPQLNHINGIKTDNRVENLEWCTNSENQIHAFKYGLQKSCFNHHNSKLKYEDVVYIKQNYKKGVKGFGIRILAKKFNVYPATIKQIVIGKSYNKI